MKELAQSSVPRQTGYVLFYLLYYSVTRCFEKVLEPPRTKAYVYAVLSKLHTPQFYVYAVLSKLHTPQLCILNIILEVTDKELQEHFPGCPITRTTYILEGSRRKRRAKRCAISSLLPSCSNIAFVCSSSCRKAVDKFSLYTLFRFSIYTIVLTFIVLLILAYV